MDSRKQFNRFFEREFADPAKDKKLPYLSSYDVDSYFQEINSSKLDGGIIKSKDGKLLIDLDSGDITYDGESIV